MSILIFTPLHPDYGIRGRTLSSIQAAISHYAGPVDWVLSSGDNPHKYPYENVAHQHNKARQMVLDNGYDALLSIESDMIVPPDTIDKLLEAESDIAYGLYIWRHKPRRWSAYKTLNLWGGESYSYDQQGDVTSDWGNIVDVAGLGMGCTLIKPNVLRAMPFRIHDGEPGWIADEYGEQFETLGIDPFRPHPNLVCDDWLLALDAQHYGFSQRANLGVVCGHIDNDAVLWPDPIATGFYKVV